MELTTHFKEQGKHEEDFWGEVLGITGKIDSKNEIIRKKLCLDE